MASRPSPDSLIHCAVCGEDYSATYRRCPFCGARNAPQSSPVPPSAPSQGSAEDDGYVFDGQDLFDDEPEEEYRLAARPKGGKRLAEKPSSNPFVSADINWPRMITFLCSLIIIIAALVIVFTVIYPQLHGTKDPNADASGSPSPAVTEPAVNSPAVIPSPGVVSTQPPAPSDSQPVEPSAGPLISMTLNKNDFTLRPGGSFQLIPTFNPSGWSGEVTWSSTDESLAKVSADGTVTHANPDVTSVHRVVITASAGGLEVQCDVYIAGPLSSSQPPASDPPAQSDPPAANSPSGNGTVTVGRAGTIVNAEGGLRVRSGPGTSYEILDSLLNGNSITVLSDEGNGWYRISYIGAGGQTMNGYIMGEYISTN